MAETLHAFILGDDGMSSLFQQVLFLATFAQFCSAQTIRLPVVADNSIVMVDGEWAENAGANGRLRVKGNQHILAVAFDTKEIAGKLIKKATLVYHQGEEQLSGLSISTIVAPWDESNSNGLWCGISGLDGWGYKGARFPAVCGGNSHSLVEPIHSGLKDGSYHWDIPVDMIHALSTGSAYGLAIHEHDADYSRNPTVFSREQSGKQPYLLVELDDASDLLPEPPKGLQLRFAEDDLPRVTFKAPSYGFAYDVSVDGIALRRHNIPLVKPDAEQTIAIRDLPAELNYDRPIKISVVTISRTGKRSEAAEIYLSKQKQATLTFPELKYSPAASLAIKDLGVIPLTDKYDATGKPVGEFPEGYPHRNSIYDGQRIRISGAAGEVVGFQLLLRGLGSHTVKIDLGDERIRTDLFQAVYVPADGRSIPDPLLPLTRPVQLSPKIAQVIVADIYLPFDSVASRITGSVNVSDGRTVPLEIQLLPIAIPRQATFFCEMNGYGLPDRVQDYYAHQRLAYDHRVHANILHYSHNTAAVGSRKSNLDMRLLTGRRMDNKRYDDIQPDATQGYWDDFVEAFGPYLDGSLFSEGHRGPIAAPGFYLTFHESWPLHCRAYFNGNPDAYQAFSHQPAYARTYVNLLQDFAKLAKSKSWTDCRFQVYFNNKGSLSAENKSPWILDEPASFWDYRALQYYGELTDKGRQQHSGVKIDYRVDISRPEYCRGQLDGRSDLWVVSSSAFQSYRRLVTDRIERDQLKAWVYGSSNKVQHSNRNILAWALDAWSHGATGLVPWQTVNKDGSALRQADDLGIFIYQYDDQQNLNIHHSMRLKAYREAQQLIEHLIMLKSKMRWSQQQMRQFINHYVDLSLSVSKVNEDDAGTSGYPNFSAQGAESLRLAIHYLLSTQLKH